MKKNLSKWLTIITPIVLAAVLLWPTYSYYQLNEERSALEGDSVSLEAWERSNGSDFKSARDSRLKLGLDLRGGMYVTLEVDVLEMIAASVERSSMDDDLRQVLEKTRVETDNTDLDVLSTFLKNFRATGKSLLAYFTLSQGTDVTEQAIEEKLRRDVDGAIDQALEVIKQRINKFDVSEALIQKQGTRRIQVELPDVKDDREIRKLLQTTAKLEFKRVSMNKDLVRVFMDIDRIVSGNTVEELTPDTTKADSSAVVSADSTKDSAAVAAAKDTTADSASKDPYKGLSEEEQRRKYRKDHPFTSNFDSYAISGDRSQAFTFVGLEPEKISDQATFQFFVPAENLKKLTAILKRPDVQRVIPSDIEILLGAKPEEFAKRQDPNLEIYQMYGVVRDADLAGDVIADAYPSFNPENNKPVVRMFMNPEGGERWAQITGANIGKQMAVILDSAVYTAPTIQNKISDGVSEISGMANVEEATLLATILKAGALKAPVRIIEERVVGPSLGEDSIRRGVTSALISFAVVILFMLAYYAVGGAIADIALLLNVVLVVAALAALGGTLTLPGIAGIILSTAMAVDANILIFERIREELAAGRTLKGAVEQGYGKAWSAIIDSNITNMLSGLVLIFLGTGPVRGFAVTLIAGVVMTLFTAVVVTRAFFEIMIASGATTINLGQKKTA